MAVISKTAKRKKKLWYDIHAPKIMNDILLGESTVYNKEDLNRKNLTLNLSTFTTDFRKQNMDVSFSVVQVIDNKAITIVTGVALTQAYIKRLVRRGKNKVDDSFVVKSKDNKVVRIKPIIITNSITNRSIVSRLRLELRSLIRKMMRTTNAEEFFNNLINQRVQKEFKEKLSKIYPLKYVDIRKALIVKERVGMKIEKVSDSELEKVAVSDSEMVQEAEEKEVSVQE